MEYDWYIISIHALREESDSQLATDGTSKPQFLSTPSARRATFLYYGRKIGMDISIHALREEGDLVDQQKRPREPPISIHALREEGDTVTSSMPRRNLIFLSTPSARRATQNHHRSHQ